MSRQVRTVGFHADTGNPGNWSTIEGCNFDELLIGRGVRGAWQTPRALRSGAAGLDRPFARGRVRRCA